MPRPKIQFSIRALMLATAVYAIGFAVQRGTGIVLATVLTLLAALIWIMSACLGITKSRAAFWTCVAYPWFGIGSLYTTWGAAWIALGHVPLPSRDDPQMIAEAVTFLAKLTYMIMFVYPLALLAIVILMIVEAVPITERAGELQLTVVPWLILAPIGSWSCALVLLGLNMGRVLNWFMD